MAHSLVEFQGRRVLMNDLEIVTVVHILLDTIHHASPSLHPSPNVQALLRSWTTILDVSSAGSLDLHLERFLQTEEDRESLLRIIDVAESSVRSFGSVVPAEYLDRIVGAPALFKFTDRSAESVLGAFDKLINVLTAASLPSRRRPVLSTVPT